MWYDSNAITNILSFQNVGQKYGITYDNAIEDAFCVHKPNEVLKFYPSKNGLYHIDARHRERHVSMANTQTENSMMYSDQEIFCGKKARTLYHTIGYPSLKDFKNIIKANLISNCDVTLDDINVAEKVFGHDMFALKGKQVHTKPLPVSTDYVKIPREILKLHHNVKLSADFMFVNELQFFISHSSKL